MSEERKGRPRRRRRKKSGDRWKARRVKVRWDREMGVNPRDPNHLRFDLDSMEFTCLTVVSGGVKVIGPAIVRAIRSDNRNVCDVYPNRFVKDGAIAPDILQIGRDKAAILMARADDAALIRLLREEQREERKTKQITNLLEAEDRGSRVWVRYDAGDMEMRYVLSGTNESDTCPTEQSDGLIVSGRGPDGRHFIAREYHSGAVDVDSDGKQIRVGVRLEVIRGGFVDAHSAHSTFKLNASLGRFGDKRLNTPSKTYLKQRAGRLRRWDRAITSENDYGELVEELADIKDRFRPKPKGKKGPALGLNELLETAE
jgi:hypothetical protein